MQIPKRCGIHCVAGAALLLAASVLPARAQVNTASLTGLVTDASGGVIAGAAVIATDTATNAVRRVTTDTSGYYLFPSLPIGTYDIAVEAPGFKRARQSGLVLNVGQKHRVDFTLQVGEVTQMVNVTAAATALQTEQASTGAVVGNNTIVNIPLKLRNWDDLLGLVGGVQGDPYTEQSGSTASGRTGGVNVHGVRSLQNNFILDGVDNNTISENVQELSTQVVHESVDAIQEFKVITNPYSAEYGRSPGAAVVVATKSGTNQFHGAGWEFVRNDKFDAADFFLNRSRAKKAQNRQNQFGGNLGGPVKKDKLFFFFNYEGTRIRRGQTRLTNVPTKNERLGDFSPAAAAANRTTYAALFDRVGDCHVKDPAAFNPDGSFLNNQIPQSCLDPEAQKIINLVPMPNLVPAAGPLDANNFLRVPLLLDNNDSYTAKGDFQLNAANHLFLRYASGHRFRFVPGAFGGIIDGTGTSAFGRQKLKSHSAALGWDRVLSPRALNEFRLGWGRDDSFAEQDPFGLNTLASAGIKGVQDNPIYSGGLPGITINSFGGVPQPAAGGGLGRLGSPDFLPKFQKTNQFQWADTVSLSFGRHQVKFGADLRLPMRNIFLDVPGLRGSWTFTGQYTGIGLADFLLGYPQAAQLSNLDIADSRLWMNSYFVEDSWQFSPRLTLNLGLRYDYATWPYEARGGATNLDLATGQKFTPAGSPFGPGLVQPDRNNFAPRLGLAYRLTPNTVLRAGYGRFYQLFERIGSEDQMELNLPWLVNNVVSTSSTTQTVNNMRVATGFNLSLDPSSVDPTKVRLRAVNTANVMPSIDQWNAGFQRALPLEMVLTMDYVGTKGTHLSVLRNLNQQLFNPDGTPTGIILYPGLGPIEFRDNMGNSEYHGLEATLEKRWKSGLAFSVAYTWSHSIDMVVDNLFSGGSGSIVPDSWNVKATNRGNSDFDYRHRLVVSYVYQLPAPHWVNSGGGRAAYHVLRDWRASGVTLARTGRPFTIFANANNSVLGVRGGITSDSYADCLGSGALSNRRSVSEWFNVTDFAVPKPPRLGSCGRNTLFGPNFVNFDFNLSRSFRYFGEGRSLEVRWDILNLFNTTHLGLPDQNASSKTFGQISSLSGDPRIMQFALKFIF